MRLHRSSILGGVLTLALLACASSAVAETGLAMSCQAPANASGAIATSSTCTDRRYVRPSQTTIVASRPNGASCEWSGADCAWRSFGLLAADDDVLTCSNDIPLGAAITSTDPCGTGGPQKPFINKSQVQLSGDGEPTGSLTLSTRVNADRTLTPTLTWSTTPLAESCTASGDAAWEGTKAPSGTQALDPFPTTTPKAYALVCTWPGQSQALLTWSQPTQNTDGTALTNLAGYRVHWGRSATQLTETAQIDNPGLLAYTFDDLASGTWFFAVRAFTSQGAESALSNIVSKAINGDAVEWSQQTGVKVPAAPSAGEVE